MLSEHFGLSAAMTMPALRRAFYANQWLGPFVMLPIWLYLNKSIVVVVVVVAAVAAGPSKWSAKWSLSILTRHFDV